MERKKQSKQTKELNSIQESIDKIQSQLVYYHGEGNTSMVKKLKNIILKLQSMLKNK